MNHWWSLEAILSKSDEVWQVGGVASAFYKDLDGEAITPEAVREAIPGFMAQRGPDGIEGGPIRLHHDFWTRFLKQAIAALSLPSDEQLSLVAGISLPLGRVTEMFVDDEGRTHWKGILSQAHPIARILWQMLKEGLIHLGVSVGGKILQTSRGRDRLGQPCTLITKIRLDELSVTDNPALRLLHGESAENGAYIAALSKALGLPTKRPVVRLLLKSSTQLNLFDAGPANNGGSKFDESKHSRDKSGKFSKGGKGVKATPQPAIHRPGKVDESATNHYQFFVDTQAEIHAESPQQARIHLKRSLENNPHLSFYKIHPEIEIDPDSSYEDEDGSTKHVFSMRVTGKHHVLGRDEDHAAKQLERHYKSFGASDDAHQHSSLNDYRHMELGGKLELDEQGEYRVVEEITPMKSVDVDHFLKKALGSPAKEFSSGDAKTSTGLDRGIVSAQPTLKPTGSKQIQLLAGETKTGLGGKGNPMVRPATSNKNISTDVWGMTVKELTRELGKCACMGKEAMASPDTLQLLGDGVYGLTGLTEAPPPELINFVRFLQYFNQFAHELPHMSDYQASGTVEAMGRDLTKALEDFVERLPTKLLEAPIRPDGSPPIARPDIQFPEQYIIY